MGFWSYYFFAKLGLYYGNFIGFHVASNLLFALVLAFPLAHGGARALRHLLAIPVALGLLYHDSWLPPLSRVWSQADALAGFSSEYLIELLTRFVNPLVLAVLAAGFVLWWLLGRRLRLATFALLGILSVPLTAQLLPRPGDARAAAAPTPLAEGAAAPGGAMGVAAGAAAAQVKLAPAARLAAFYDEGRRRLVKFQAPGGQPAFDLIVVHVCSLGWDDLEFVNLRSHPFFNRFDLVFRNFNSAASYSGPAAVRLLKGSCGQKSNNDLYDPNPQCQLFGNLREAGFSTEALLNHDGRYAKFAATIENEGGFGGKAIVPAQLPAAMHSFDGTPIYSDLAVLSQWWAARQQRGAGAAALYYNTVTLHDGNRLPGSRSFSSLETYKPRLVKMLDELDQFVRVLETSQRPVALVLVAEHGGALRGDRVQISGMREIPGPRITLVPAAVKLIGMPGASAAGAVAQPQWVDTPTSYFALTTLLSRLVAGETGGAAALAANLPTTEFVAENDNIVVMGNPGAYQMRSPDGTWIEFSE